MIKSMKLFIDPSDSGYDWLKNKLQNLGATSGSLIQLTGEELSHFIPEDMLSIGTLVVSLAGEAILIPRTNRRLRLPRILGGGDAEIIENVQEQICLGIKQSESSQQSLANSIDLIFDSQLANLLKQKIEAGQLVHDQNNAAMIIKISPQEIIPRGNYQIVNRYILERNPELLSSSDQTICLAIL